jgi:hypothetical protein
MGSKPEDTVVQSQRASSSVYRFQDPWFARAWDNFRLFSIQLACAGGSGAVAKTAVAPLERVKVNAVGWPRISSASCLTNERMVCQILMQVQRMSNTPVDLQYKGMLDALRRIPSQEGGFLVRPADCTLHWSESVPDSPCHAIELQCGCAKPASPARDNRVAASHPQSQQQLALCATSEARARPSAVERSDGAQHLPQKYARAPCLRPAGRRTWSPHCSTSLLMCTVNLEQHPSLPPHP